MILRHKVSVSRINGTVKSPTGTPRPNVVVVTASLPCDLQPHKGIVVVPTQGQTTVYYKTMFCYLTDIQINDIVTNLDTGEKLKVININDWNLLKHLEVSLEGGVL